MLKHTKQKSTALFGGMPNPDEPELIKAVKAGAWRENSGGGPLPQGLLAQQWGLTMGTRRKSSNAAQLSQVENEEFRRNHQKYVYFFYYE